MSAEDSARTSIRSKRGLEFALEMLANDVERVLAEEPGAPPGIYFARDFDNPALAPGDLVT